MKILINELLPGATITLPSDISHALSLVRLASRWMFTFFLLGTILTFHLIFLAPFGVSSYPRQHRRGQRLLLRSIPLTVLAALALVFTLIASVVATVMFVIFRNIVTGQQDLQIEASVGTQMLAFMWTAVALDLLGFLLQAGICCSVCCCSGKRRYEKEKGHDQE